MVKKILIILLGLLIIAISKIFIYRKGLYLYPVLDEKPYADFISTTNTTKFNLIDTLGWYIPGSNTKKIVIFCHGNSYNITWKTPVLTRLSKTFKCPIICIDYLRSKHISISNMFDRTTKLVDGLLSKGFDKSNIIMFGESLGCAIAVQVASKYKIPNVISYIGFRSMKDIAKEKIPWIGNIFGFFINELDNQSVILENNFIITLLNSPDDKLVNFSHIKEMAELTGAELLEIKGPHSKPEIPDDVLLRLKVKYNL
jgi:hypothetical protein